MGSEGFVPIVRFLHFSDTHFAQLQKQVPSKYLSVALSRRWGSHIGQLLEHLRQGIAGHSTPAFRALRRSIVDYVRTRCQGAWAGRTRLLCTGDLTTWGDDASLHAALRFVEGLRRDAALEPEATHVLYGNHDVWPKRPGQIRGLPIFATRGGAGLRRSEMRQTHFNGCTWLHRYDSPKHDVLRVGLFSLNTIEHCPFWNTWASGEAQVDRYWEGYRTPEQLQELTAALQEVDVAFIFTHHPVHDEVHHVLASVPPSGSGPISAPPPSPSLKPLLKNAFDAGAVVRTAAGPAKTARFVLSGHTHRLFPKVGDLPRQGPINHGFLFGNCGQLTVGTACQQFVPCQNRTDPFIHYWQSLSLWFHPVQKQVVLERTVFQRNDRSDFYPVAPTADPPIASEQLSLSLA